MSLTDHAVIHPRHRAMMMATLMLVTIIHWTDMTIAVVALPAMQGSLGASREQISWVITAYVVAAAVATPPAAFLASRFGRKNMFLFSVALFTLASIACGFSQNLEQIVFFRIVQGLAGGFISPLAQATMLDAYPREKMGSAMATFSIGTMIGPILAPTIGGYLTEYHDWRWVFFINIPIGMLAIAGIVRYVPRINDMVRPKFDTFGFVLLLVVIIALQLLLDRGVSKAWFQSPEIMIEAFLVLLCGYMFMVHLRTAKNPFVTLAIFRDRNYATAMIFSFLLGLSMLATMVLSPNFTQILLGIPPMTTGFVIMPRMFAMLLAMQIVGRLVNHVDPRLIILFGLGLTAVGYYQMSGFSLNTTIYQIIVTGLWQGFGSGLTFVPMTIIAFATLSPMYRPEASGMMNLSRSIASGIGISAMVTILSRVTVTNQAHIRELVHPYTDPFSFLAPIVSTAEGGAVAALVNGEILRQAAMIGYNNCYLVLTILTLVTMPFVFIMKKPPPIVAPGAPPSPPPQKNPAPALASSGNSGSPSQVKSGIEAKPGST